MIRKAVLGMILTLLLVSISFALNIQTVKTTSLTVHNVDTGENFASIQEAIDDPDTLDGHTILVDAGVYYEHASLFDCVIIHKSISLVGEGADVKNKSIIDGNGTFVTIVHVTASNVSIRGFVIRNDARIYGFVGGGIYLNNSNGNNIFENRITNTQYAINLEESTGNTINGNLIEENDLGMLFPEYSSNNTIYHNNFIDNYRQVGNLEGASSIWDNGCEGNYWSDYTGTDADGDGIGDNPYVIDEYNQDGYPLMNPYVYVFGDINLDGTVDINDLLLLDNAYGTEPEDPNWKYCCDITGSEEKPDGLVDIYDLAAVGKNFGEKSD